jgi:hypothetical protein
MRRLAFHQIVARGRAGPANASAFPDDVTGIAAALRGGAGGEHRRAWSLRALGLVGLLDEATVRAAAADDSRLVRVHLVKAVEALPGPDRPHDRLFRDLLTDVDRVCDTALIMHQPDLGTALLVAGSGVGVMFLAGLKWRYIIPAGIAAVAAAVYAYFSVLQGYQRDRVNVFLGLENDPLGSGYHVLQSKIAIGAAGLLGHGYLKGPQSQLDFLPEKHTDFIFTMIVEEFGLVGAFVVLGLFGIALALTMTTALRSRTMFGRLAASGVAVTLGLYVFINTSMVIGLIPVVGIPLPLLSFGGTAMLTVMIGMSIVLSIHLHRETSISSRGVLW